MCGVDIDEAVISVARANYRESNLHFEVGDATTINIAGVFNTIILSNVLEHIAERTAFLLKLRHVYNPNTILIRVPNFERDWRVPLKRELGIDYRLDKTHHIEHTPNSLIEELKSAQIIASNIEYRWGEIWVIAHPS